MMMQNNQDFNLEIQLTKQTTTGIFCNALQQLDHLLSDMPGCRDRNNGW